MGFVWQKPLVQVVQEGIPFWSRDIATVLTQELEQEAESAEVVMKAMAPWQDRTGMARAGLQSFVINGWPDHIAWYFAYSPDTYYGMFLETMKAGAFAIVVPTSEMYYPQMVWHLQSNGFRIA